MKSEPLAPGAAAIILYRQVDRDDNGMTSHEDNFYRIKVLTEEGVKHANIEIPFNKLGEDVVNVKGRTIRPDGSVVPFDGKIAEQTIVKGKDTKYLAKTFALPDVHPGSIIEYSYSYDFKEHWIYDSHWILSEELFTRLAVFTLKPYSSSYNRFSVRWLWQGLPAGTEPPKEGPDHIVRLTARNIPAFQTEDFMPPATELKARVDFIYSDDPTDRNPEQFWKNFGKKHYSDWEHFIDKRNALQQAVGQIVSAQDSPEDKARKIYYRVQQLRNTAYEPSKTAQEQSREQGAKKTPNAEDVWSRGWGDDDEITWLFLGLVRAAGLDANGVMVSSRSRYFFRPQVEVDGHRLNGYVVLLHLGGKDVYCDPGAKYHSFGLLPWYETGIAGLKLDKDGGSWIEIPLPPSSVSVIDRKAELKLTDTGDLEGKLTITYSGQEAAQLRTHLRNDDEAGRKKEIEENVESLIPIGSEVTLTNKPEWTNSAEPLVGEFSLKVTGWASQTGRRVMLPVGLFSAQEKRTFGHAERTHPIYIEYANEQKDNISITVPTGWQIGTLPPSDTQDKHIISFSFSANKDNSTIHIQRSLSVNFMLLENKYYSALRNFYQGMKSSDDQQIVLQPAAASASK